MRMRKQGNGMYVLTVRVPVEDRAGIEVLAARRGVDASTITREMIRACLARPKQPISPHELETALASLQRDPPKPTRTESGGFEPRSVDLDPSKRPTRPKKKPKVG